MTPLADKIIEAGRAESASLERLAVALAEACNGGKWETHYTDEQRNRWRHRAAQIVKAPEDLDYVGLVGAKETPDGQV